jgi:hypothetical protein
MEHDPKIYNRQGHFSYNPFRAYSIISKQALRYFSNPEDF